MMDRDDGDGRSPDRTPERDLPPGLTAEPAASDEVDEEIRFHLERRAEDLMAEGVPPSAARARARREFGDVEEARRVMEEHVEKRRLRRRKTRLGQDLVQDLKTAFRQLVRRPVQSGMIVATLALAIGANTAIFSVVSQVFFRPLAVQESDRLVSLFGVNEQTEVEGAAGAAGVLPVSYPNLDDLSRRASTLTDVYARNPYTFSVGGEGRPTRVQGTFVDGAYFPALGISPRLGRAFQGVEADPDGGGLAVVVLGHGLWQRRYGGDPDMVGRSIQVNGRSLTVVGVLPEGFVGVDAGTPVELWVPASLMPEVHPMGDWWDLRRALFWFAGARLRDGASVEQARAELASITRGLRAEHPDELADFSFSLLTFAESRVNPAQRDFYVQAGLILFAMVATVLLVACANVANLLLARAWGRSREIAVRRSLGAGRGRIVRQLLTEAVVLFSLGGIAGLLVAYWGADLLGMLRPPFVPPETVAFSLDLRVLAFTGAVTVVTGLAFGLFPALEGAGVSLMSTLRDRQSNATGSGSPLAPRNVMVVVQVALAVVALFGAGLFLRGLQAAGEVDPGFDAERIALVSFDPGGQGYGEDEIRTFYDEALSEARALPGVRAASVAQLPPLGFGPLRRIIPEDDPTVGGGEGVYIRVNAVSGDYFETMGIALRRGRPITADDRADSRPVAVINQTMARRYWPDRDAVGRRFHMSQQEEPIEVVGVVADARYVTLGEDPQSAIYVSMRQIPPRVATLHARTDASAEALAETLRRALQPLDPEMPLFDARSAGALVDDALWAARTGAILLSLFGALALVLAALGIYGVLAGNVRDREAEMGLRRALGADAGGLLGLVLRQVGSLVLVGAVLGLGLAFVLARLASDLVYGVSPADPWTLVGVAGVLGLAALLAALLPALRAIRVDPVRALKGG